MKQHYKTLQVSRNATPEEIKEKYRQLAREHHPDKFQEGNEKLAAEERFIEITEAYNGLKETFKPSAKSGYVDPSQPPTPVLSQTLLDFGTMHCGTRKTITFVVQNDGGPVESVRFDYDKARGWLKVQEAVSHSTETMAFPLEIEVTVDTSEMDPLLTYQDKIDIWLNDQMARVTLVAGVKEQPKILAYLSTFSPQLIALILFLIATVSGIFALAKTQQGPVIFAHASQSNAQQAIVPNNEGTIASDISVSTESINRSMASKALVNAEYSITKRVDVNLLEIDRPLIFSKGTRQKQLYVMHKLLDKPYNLEIKGYSPIWSPKQQQIAFLRDTEAGTQVYVADISATEIDSTQQGKSIVFTTDEPRQLTNTEFKKADISWSPNGKQIAFREQLIDATGNSFEILKAVDLTGEEPKLLSIPSQGNVSHFTWTRDSKTLFATFAGVENEKVYIVDMESGFAEPFVQFESRDAAWSPDGQHIAIASNQGLYLLDKNKENVRRLSTISNWKPSWSPNGSALAFLGSAENDNPRASSRRAIPSLEDADLWLLDIESEEITRLTTEGALDFTWGPTEESLVYTAVSEDLSKTTIQMWSLELGGQAEILDEVSDPQIAWVSQ